MFYIFLLYISINYIIQESLCILNYNSNIFKYFNDNTINTKEISLEVLDDVESLLPNDIIVKLDAIKSNFPLKDQEKYEEIDKIIKLLPPEIINKIPTSFELKTLLKDVIKELQKIMDNKHFSITEKRLKTGEIIEKNLNIIRDTNKLYPSNRRAKRSLFNNHDSRQYDLENIEIEGSIRM